jgi:hypothetical protein
MEPTFRKYGVEYGLDGKRWFLDVMATDTEDAMRRVRQAAAFGTCDGFEIARVPMWGGGVLLPFVVFAVWLRNLCARKR